MARFALITPPPAGFSFQVGEVLDDAQGDPVLGLQAAGVLLAPLPDVALEPALEQARVRLARGEAQATVASHLLAQFLTASAGVVAAGLASQAAWYVDPVAGLDSQDGSVGRPLRTLGECWGICRRRGRSMLPGCSPMKPAGG